MFFLNPPYQDATFVRFLAAWRPLSKRFRPYSIAKAFSVKAISVKTISKNAISMKAISEKAISVKAGSVGGCGCWGFGIWESNSAGTY